MPPYVHPGKTFCSAGAGDPAARINTAAPHLKPSPGGGRGTAPAVDEGAAGMPVIGSPHPSDRSV